MTTCPCGSGQSYDTCCGPIIEGAPAQTAEALMRSRYTAYVRGAIDHIAATNAVSAADAFDPEQARQMSEELDWQGLEVVSVQDGGPDDSEGVVEFRLRFSRLGQDMMHHEASRFVREDGRWKFESGEMNPKQAPVRVDKVGRNDPCPCGSGKKFKKCCGA